MTTLPLLSRLVAATALLLSVWTAAAGPLTLADNLDRNWFGSDRLTNLDWDAQSFNSGEARQLKRLVLNLYKDSRPSVAVAGNFWVKLYDASGPGGSPGTNAVAVLTDGRPIADLSVDRASVVDFDNLSIALEANARYFVLVGCDSGGMGLLWGFTQDSVNAIGFPSIFTFTADSGANWQLPFLNALPQRMQVIGDNEPPAAVGATGAD